MQSQGRVGQNLGNYQLVKLLGKGGYSEVYLAQHIHLGGKTAIKVLKARDLDNLEQEKFRSEAKMVTTLDHPRIIKVLDYGIEMSSQQDASTPYIVMEYAPLGTLRTLYPHRTPMPLQKVALYTKQIAEALQYAHDKNIIHQDIKPENLLVRKEDDAALSDFGIAVTDMNTGNLPLQQAAIQQRNARGEQLNIVGTVPYLAPERLQGHIRRAGDQYSLAVVVYEWLTGRRPFEGTLEEVLVKHASEAPPRLVGTYPNISPEVEKVVMKALAKSPDDRYKSVHDFAVALDRAIQGSQSTSRPEPSLFTPGVPSPAPSNRPSSPPPSPQPFIPPTPPPSAPPRQTGGQPVMPANTFSMPITRPPGLAPQGVNNAANPPWQASNMNNTSSPPPWQGGSFQQQPGPTSWGGRQQQQAYGFTGYEDATVGNFPPRAAGPAPKTKDFGEWADEFAKNPGKVLRELFVGDEFFLQKPAARKFFQIGVVANLLSALLALIALIPGGLLFSIFIAFVGGALSIIMLWRCVISVRKPVAIGFGVGVGIWWGIVAALVTARFAFAPLSFPLALLISTGIHFWYVNNRLKR